MNDCFANRKAINLEITNKCTLQCKRCVRQLYEYDDVKVPGRDMTLTEYQKILDHFDYICFSGNVSDPTMHPSLPMFLQLAYSAKKYCRVCVAASHRPLSWFIDAFESNPDAEWTFGIDGLPNTSHIYRQRQDGKKLFDIMRVASNIVSKVNWQYIIFSYNEKDIEEAKTLAQKYKINLYLTKSSRFFDNDDLKPSEGNYYPSSGFEKSIKQYYENTA